MRASEFESGGEGTRESSEEHGEDLRDLSPEFLASIEGLSPMARRGLIDLEREYVDALRARGGRPFDQTLGDAITTEALTGIRLNRLRAAVAVHQAAGIRRDAAILDAREVGYSWGEIARIVGVSRQALHRRFREPHGEE